MKREFLLIFTIICLTRTSNAQTWTVQNSSAPANATFKSVSAATSSYIVAAGATASNGRLFAYSADGGTSWTHPANVWTQASKPINDILVTPSNYIHHALLPANYSQATNIETGGGGSDGFAGPFNLATGAQMNKMFINGQVKVMVGKNHDDIPIIESTTSSGGWGNSSYGNFNGTDTWNNVYCVGSTTWVIGNNGKLNKNNDVQTTAIWADISTGVTSDLKGIYFLDANIGFIVGSNGTILKTSNGGTSWTSSNQTTNNLHAVTFVNNLIGWAVGENGTILQTTDQGASWTVYTSPTTNHLYDLTFINPFVGWAVGANGTIIKFQDNCTNTTSFSAVSCGTYNWGNQQYTTSGNYTQVFANQFGCDSSVTVNLTVYPAIPVVDIYPSACDSYTFNGTTYTQSGMYLETLTSIQYGCDSLVRINLNIEASQQINASNGGNFISAFGGFGNFQWVDCSTNFSVIVGANSQSYNPTQNGSYAVILNNMGVCPADTSDCVAFCVGSNTTVTLAGNTLTAQQSGASYQWLDCDNGNAPISGATLQSFTPTITGNYAVEISINGCATISGCSQVTIGGGSSSINETFGSPITLYPNPTNDHINLENLKEGTQITVYDVTGKLMYSKIVESTVSVISTSDWENGIYLVQTSFNGIKQQTKLIVNK